MSPERIEAYNVGVRKVDEKARKDSDGVYLAVHLPEEINEIGLSEGDHLYLDLQSMEINGTEVYFIKASEDRISRHKLKIHYRGDLYPRHYVRIPIEYTFNRENQSFHGLEPGDGLTAELRYIEGELFIFTPEGYRYRSLRISEDEGLPPTVAQPSGGVIVGGNDTASEVDVVAIPTDSVEVGNEFSVIGRVLTPRIDSVMFQFRKKGDNLWNNRKFDPHSRSIDLVDDYYKDGKIDSLRLSFPVLGKYEFRVLLINRLGHFSSDIHTVTIVDSKRKN